MLIKKLSLVLSLVALTACGGSSDDDSTDSGATDSGSTDSGSTDSGTTDPSGFSMTGSALDLATLGPAAEGLCVYAADPTAAMGGGALDILGGSQIGAAGAFTIDNVVTSSVVGLFVIVQDCEGAAETTVMPTATGVSPGDVASVGDGETLEGLIMLSISNQMAQGINMSLTNIGYDGGDITTTGMMAGFVRDNATAPIAGATVGCTTGDGTPCASVFYADAEPMAGGLFASDTAVNTSTVAEAGGLFVVPAAPIFTYSAAHADYTFTDQIFGSVPGLATFMTFFAE